MRLATKDSSGHSPSLGNASTDVDWTKMCDGAGGVSLASHLSRRRELPSS